MVNFGLKKRQPKSSCEHTVGDLIGLLDELPLNDGQNTNLLVFQCRICGTRITFPKVNFNLARTQGTGETVAELKKWGLLT